MMDHDMSIASDKKEPTVRDFIEFLQTCNPDAVIYNDSPGISAPISSCSALKLSLNKDAWEYCSAFDAGMIKFHTH